MNQTRIVCNIVSAVLACAHLTCAQPSFQPLGIPFGTIARSFALSSDGSTAVGAASSTSVSEPYRWTATGALGLGYVNPAHTQGVASGVNSDGSVVVGFSGNEAMRWTEGSGMRGLGFLPGGQNSWARGVSGDGSIAVGWSTTFGGIEAFRWENGQMVGLGDLPGGDYHSRAFGISADGSTIVGEAHDINNDQRAFRWTLSGGLTALEDLPGGEVWSGASSVNDDGTFVVGFGVSALGGEAVRWDANGIAIPLGDLPGGDRLSSAADVSADGSIVVGSSRSAAVPNGEAFYWTEHLGMVSLKDHLLSLGATGLDGWILRSATGVSADGLTIAGFGVNPQGFDEAWIAHIPSPSSCALLAMAGVLGTKRKR